MADVFISYSKVDRAIAESLANDLKARGFEVWWDFELYAGDNFQSMIRVEIAKAKAVVVIWSDTAAVSEWVYGEAMLASRRGTMVSAHVPGFDVHEVPINFLPLHCEPVVNRDRLVAAIERKGVKGKIAAPKSAPIDESTPLDELRARAAAGEADAQNELGLRHYFGRSVLQSYEEAARLYGLASEQGDAVARYNLGVMLAKGRGVAKDESKAARFFRLSAEQGYAAAQYNLGIMYTDGLGVAKDDVEAVRLYRLAAEQGDAAAQYNLGVMFAQGRGAAQDEAEAVRFSRLAAAQGDEDAKEALARRGISF